MSSVESTETTAILRVELQDGGRPILKFSQHYTGPLWRSAMWIAWGYQYKWCHAPTVVPRPSDFNFTPSRS